MRKLILILLTVLCMSGCATGPKVNTIPYSQAPVIAPDADSAVVYVMREWGFMSGGRNFVVYEDGEVIGSLTTDSYIIHRTGVGKHHYSVEEVTYGTILELVPGKAYYVLVSIGGSNLTVTEVTEQMARQILPKLKYAVPMQ
jgi:hypothetical protein